MSVRKIQSIIGHMAELKILIWTETKQFNVPVLNVNEEIPTGLSLDSWFDKFVNQSRLPIENVDVSLFDRLKTRRKSISWGIGRNKYDRGWAMKICTDRILILICIHRPKDLVEFRQKIPYTKKLLDYAQSLINVYMGDSLVSSSIGLELKNAVENNQVVEIYYDKYTSQNPGWRTITPRILYLEKGIEYCNAYCHKREADRMFKIAHITQVRIL